MGTQWYQTRTPRRRPSLPQRVAACAMLGGLVSGCVFGPSQLEKGHLAYNDAVKSAADEELLLNIVRLRYVDTLDFMATNSISSQLVLGVTAGARGGSDTLAGGTGASGYGEFTYSTRPTFTFTPQRGQKFAQQLIEPVGITTLAYLIAADWDAKMVFRLLVRRLNGVDNELGLPSPEFVEITDRLEALQIHNQLFVGFIRGSEALSDPIDPRNVSGADLVAAAKSGLRFRQETRGGPFVLTSARSQPVMAFEAGSQDPEALTSLLRLRPGRSYYDLTPGADVGTGGGERESLSVRTGSLLRAIIYLAQGVDVPAEHVEDGLTSAEFPPGAPGVAVDDIFHVHASSRRPSSQLAVRHRGHWFYVDDSDLASRWTFFHVSQLFRLGLAQGAAQAAPVLTLPVGGP